MNVVEIINVSKSFNKKQVLNHLNFNIEDGEIFGLLGGNGAGKSTITNIIFGLEEPTSGEVKIFSKETPKEARNKMGLVPQETAFYNEFTVRENILFFAYAFGLGSKAVERSNHVLKWLDLEDFSSIQAGHLSGGYQRMLNTAITLLPDPRIIFFDEPTVGLDPEMRRSFWKLIKSLKEMGKTIILTTHYMDEAENLCNRIILLKKGNLLIEGNPNKLINEHGGERMVRFELVKEMSPTHVTNLSELLNTKVTLAGNSIYFAENKNNSLVAGNWIEKKKLEILSIEIKEPSLENAFINLLGEKPVEVTDVKK